MPELCILEGLCENSVVTWNAMIVPRAYEVLAGGHGAGRPLRVYTVPAMPFRDRPVLNHN